jgi:protein-disulfide isomerase
MKPSYYLLAAAAILASGACNAKQGNDAASGNSVAGFKAEAVKPPANGDWSTVVAATSAGGFRMGNPDAKVQLVEYGSLTCPHCREFDEKGVGPLIDQYVKSGKVSYEFRNYVRDPFDISAALIARCNGSKTFFPLVRALYKDQTEWIGKLQAVPQAQIEALTNLGPDKQFLEIAKAAGLQQWATQRGVPTAKSTACLTNQTSVNQLVQMNSDATNQYDIPGTPTFLINGKVVEQAATWEALQPKLQQAVGG